MGREKVSDEIAAELIEHIRELIAYWESIQVPSLEKLNGLAFSILAALDGCSDGVPGFIVAPLPHPEDKEYLIEKGENYYPENHELEQDIKGDIGGTLHEIFFRVKDIEPIRKKVEKRYSDRFSTQNNND